MDRINQSTWGRLRRVVASALGAVCVGGASLGATQAAAFTPPPNNISIKFEGCRIGADSVLPASNLCPDSYTEGNLGKNWAEWDLVPFHLVLGNSGPATTYSLFIAADYLAGGFYGYDVIATPKATGGCTVSAGPQFDLANVTGGTDRTAYRELTINQAAGASCTIDWVQRLAIGASQFNGSNLQSYIFDQEDLSGGKRTIPIPVNQIAPQLVSKTMDASRGASQTWKIEKSGDSRLHFDNVCADPQAVLKASFTVKWDKVSVDSNGNVTIVTTISGTNPASRSVSVELTDRIYSGPNSTGTLLSTQTRTGSLGPSQSGNLATITHVISAADATTNGLILGSSVSDTVDVKYVDSFGPGSVTKTASATAVINAGAVAGGSVALVDTEKIDPATSTAQFAVSSVDKSSAVVNGGFDGGYVLGTKTTQVEYDSTGMTAGGSLTFNKNVYLGARRILTLEDKVYLQDIATLTTETGPVVSWTSNLVKVPITSDALVSIVLKKTLPAITVPAGAKIVMSFEVRRKDGSVAKSTTIASAGSVAAGTVLSQTITGLAPDTYTVHEVSSVVLFGDGSTQALGLAATPAAPMTTKLAPDASGVLAACSEDINMSNALPPSSSVLRLFKVVDPFDAATEAGRKWKFTVTFPNSDQVAYDVAATTLGTFSYVDVPLPTIGSYSISEAVFGGWFQFGRWQSVQPGDPSGADFTARNVSNPLSLGPELTCSFNVATTLDLQGKVYTCGFKNSSFGKVIVNKTTNLGPPNGVFTFQLRYGATKVNLGTVVEEKSTTTTNGNLVFATSLMPGATYQMCESVAAGWLTTIGTFVPGSVDANGVPVEGVDNSWVCSDFKVDAGGTYTFNVNNTPPPEGRALTIGYWKNHASCTTSSTKKEAALDAALFKAGGIFTGTKIDSLSVAGPGPFGLYGGTTATAVSPDCNLARLLLDKRNFSEAKMAKDPMFNMVAQLTAVRLNLAEGSYSCARLVSNIGTAEGLMNASAFTGYTYNAVSKTVAQQLNTLATYFDNYNNDRAGVCP